MMKPKTIAPLNLALLSLLYLIAEHIEPLRLRIVLYAICVVGGLLCIAALLRYRAQLERSYKFIYWTWSICITLLGVLGIYLLYAPA